MQININTNTKQLAIFKGWKEQIMTETESPNYLIDNPESPEEYLDRTYFSTIRTDIRDMLLSETKSLANTKIAIINAELEQAKGVAESEAKQLVEITK